MFNLWKPGQMKEVEADDLEERVGKLEDDLLELKQKTCEHRWKYSSTFERFVVLRLSYIKECTLCGFRMDMPSEQWAKEKGEQELSEAKNVLEQNGYEIHD